METIDGLIEGLRDTCAGLPDRRRGQNGHYTMADIGMAAFAVFFMQSPSFLAHQRHLAQGSGHGRSNCETLFGMTKIPSDNHIRAMLDGVRPECFYPLFVKSFDAIERDGGLAEFRATSVAATMAWKYSILPVPRLRVEQHGQCSFAERKYSVPSKAIST